MLITSATTTADSTLPLYVPDLPNPATHRWVADSLPLNGAMIVPPVTGGISLTDATGSATTLPTASTVDGARALTFDGTAQQAYALNANPGPGGSVSGYAVVKITSDPAAIRSIIHWNTVAMGFNATRKFAVGSAAAATSFTLNQWYAVGWSVKRNTGTGDAEWRVAVSTGETAQVLSQNQAALSTFAGFGVGATSTKTPMVVRDLAITVGTAHSIAQLQANVAALKQEYSIA